MKMKQSSSTHFGGIPLDTNTLAGQWMTFSHMANHYRKLLNVKPRVDTGLALASVGSSSNLRGSYHNLSTNSKMLQSSKSGKKKKNSTNGNNASTANNSIYNHHHQHSGHQRDDLMYSSHPDHLNSSSSGRHKQSSTANNNNVQLTIKSPLKHGQSKKKALTSHYPEYQVVFGPSSIRSSSDAFLSDDSASTVSNDTNKPPPDVQAPIGVTEKIRRFLSHIHQLDLTTATKPSKKSKRVTTAQLTPTCSSVVTAERPNSVNSTAVVTTSHRQARHSKCFLPYEPPSPSPKTPRKCVSSSVATSGAGLKSSRNQSSSKNKKFLSTSNFSEDEHTSQQFSKSAHHFSHSYHQQKSPKMSRNKFTGSGGDVQAMIPEKDASSGKRPKTRKRGGSIGSIGTICGSEELTAEDYHVSMKDVYSTLEHSLGDEDLLLKRIMDDNLHSIKTSKKSSRKVLQEKDHNKRATSTATSLMKSNSMASLVPSSSADGGSTGNSTFVKPNRHHHHHNHHEGATTAGVHTNGNNKDSSRDSAYGFSSGESRITTRESTPEKKCLSEGLHTSVGTSTRRSHVDFEGLKPSKDAQTSSTSIDKRYNKSSHRHNSKSKFTATSTVDLRRRDSNERYIMFLTDMTQDIVRKGIYTNKGLKKLFKCHLEQNKELNPDKLTDMVERLRMDLGIPKDDSLDKMEFGYGSVSDLSTTNYFYTPSVPPQEKLSTESVILSAKTVSQTHPEDPASNPSSHPSSPSPTTIIPTAVIPQVVEAATAISSMTPMTSTTTTGFSSSNRSSTTGTTEEGSGAGDFISERDSEENFITSNDKHRHHDDDEEDEGNVHNDEDELSLSETEVSQYLKVAGLDDGTMQSVMGILKS